MSIGEILLGPIYLFLAHSIRFMAIALHRKRKSNGHLLRHNKCAKCMAAAAAGIDTARLLLLYSICSRLSLPLFRLVSASFVRRPSHFGSSLKRKISQRSATIHFLFHVPSVIYTRRKAPCARDRPETGLRRIHTVHSNRLAGSTAITREIFIGLQSAACNVCACVYVRLRMRWAEWNRRRNICE